MELLVILQLFLRRIKDHLTTQIHSNSTGQQVVDARFIPGSKDNSDLRNQNQRKPNKAFKAHDAEDQGHQRGQSDRP